VCISAEVIQWERNAYIMMMIIIYLLLAVMINTTVHSEIQTWGLSHMLRRDATKPLQPAKKYKQT